MSHLSSPQVLHVITEPIGGGAQVLVRELNRRSYEHGIASSAVYFSNPRGIELSENEYCLGFKSPRSPRIVFALRQFLKTHTAKLKQPLIVHAHLTWPLYYVAIAAMGLPVTLVYTEHNTHNKRRNFRILARFERFLYRRYNQIICISEGTREALDRWLNDQCLRQRLVVIPNGARLLEPKPTGEYLKTGGLKLVSVGSLSPKKGFETAIRAVSEKRMIVDSYTIVGEGPTRARLESLIDSLNLQDTVRLVGWADDVGQHYRAADVAVIPSRWEGFGLVAVEALSVGLPVIASDVPGLRELLSGCEAAVLVSEGDTTQIAEAIEKIKIALENGIIYSALAIDRSKSYSLDKMISTYSEHYYDITHSGAGSTR
ncbi:MAG: glycosyltransferase [Leptolyngbyaceae cyanobacterium MO_188.B28]|nr:glycosyltransferase [Leptolyngbyaceae cyanobacterium MO_188.B28]